MYVLYLDNNILGEFVNVDKVMQFITKLENLNKKSVVKYWYNELTAVHHVKNGNKIYCFFRK